VVAEAFLHWKVALCALLVNKNLFLASNAKVFGHHTLTFLLHELCIDQADTRAFFGVESSVSGTEIASRLFRVHVAGMLEYQNASQSENVLLMSLGSSN